MCRRSHLAQHLQRADRMERGQSSVEYLLVTTIFVLGVGAILTSSSFLTAFSSIYREVAHRVGSDSIAPSP